MKSLMKVTCTALLFTGIMAGCSGNATQNKKKRSSKNAMHYGEIFKTNTIEQLLKMLNLKK